MGRRSVLQRAADKSEAVISRACAVVATFASRRPWQTIGLCLFWSLVLATGFVKIKNEDRPDKLYVPRHMKSQVDRDWVDDRFESADAASTVLLDHRGDVNLLTKAALREAFDVYDLVLGIESEQQTRGYDERSCAKAEWNGLCAKSSVLAFWNYSRAALEADEDILGTVNGVRGDCCSPRSRVADLDAVAAKLRRDEAGTVFYAGAFKLDFYLAVDEHEKSGTDPHQLRLEKKFDKKLRSASYESFERPMPVTFAGLAENVDGAFDYDRYFVNLASVIIFAYAYWALFDRKNPYVSRGWLGVAAAVVVLVAVVAAFGVALYCGAIFSATASIAVFLVLGIGLDDAFVICGAEVVHFGDFFDDARDVRAGTKSVEDAAAARVERAMATAGPSITVTSVTDFCAFVAGSFTAIPAISSFCAFCASAVAVDFFLQTTLFVALFSLDLRRKLRRAARELGDDDDVTKTCACKRRAASEEALRDVADAPNCYGSSFASMLLSKPGMVVIVLITMALAGLGASGAALCTAEWRYEWFIVDGWYEDNYNFNKKHFSNEGVAWVGLYTGHADYYEEGDTMRQLLDAYADHRFVVASSLTYNWFDAHARWAKANGNVIVDRRAGQGCDVGQLQRLLSISVVVHSCSLTFGRVIISRHGLEA